MPARTDIPDPARLLYDLLTVRRFGRPRLCSTSDLQVFSWAPLIGFIYGEHAVNSGHAALLFKLPEFVAVALLVDRNVPETRIRLRAWSHGEALNWFANATATDFVPHLEHEESDYPKFQLIEDLLHTYVQLPEHAHRLRDRESTVGVARILHVSFFRPGSGVNWSGSSAVAISNAIHKHYFREAQYDDDDVRRLAYAIELTYQDGGASGYGFAAFESSQLVRLRLTRDGVAKAHAIRQRGIQELLARALKGDLVAHDQYINFVLNRDNVIHAREQDYQILPILDSPLDDSIRKLLSLHVDVVVVDSAVPKSTGKILASLPVERIPSWHSWLAQAWESRQTVPICSPDELREFVGTISHRLQYFAPSPDDPVAAKVPTKLWVRQFDQMRESWDAEQEAFKFTGSGGGGCVVVFPAKQRCASLLSRVRSWSQIHARGSPRSDRDPSLRCRYWSVGLSDARPKAIGGGRTSRPGHLAWIIGALLVTGLALLVGVYLALTRFVARFIEASPPPYAFITAFAVLLVLSLSPSAYRAYRLASRTTPAHYRGYAERRLQRDWWLCRRVGLALDLLQEPGWPRLLMWLVVALWSNVLALALLLIGLSLHAGVVSVPSP